SGVATFVTNSLLVGTHPISAHYAGVDPYASANSNLVLQSVQFALASVTETSTVNPSVFGQSVTLNVVVSGSSGPPSGNAIFKDGTIVLATVALDSFGRAAYPTSMLTTGSHSMTVRYTGDANYAPTTSSVLTQVVGRASVDVALTTSMTPSVYGEN